MRLIQDEDGESLVPHKEGTDDKLQRTAQAANQVVVAALQNLGTALMADERYTPLYIKPDPEIQAAVARQSGQVLGIIGAYTGDARENFKYLQMEVARDGLIKKFKFRFSDRGPMYFKDYVIDGGSLTKPSVSRGSDYRDPVSDRNEIISVAAYLQDRINREISLPPGKRARIALEESEASSYFGPKWFVIIEDAPAPTARASLSTSQQVKRLLPPGSK